jgi:hypothetical protein
MCFCDSPAATVGTLTGVFIFHLSRIVYVGIESMDSRILQGVLPVEQIFALKVIPMFRDVFGCGS